ncbi:HD family hydrolase [Serratia symbiotica]|uniref:HD family hydrolase n=1 Tax=Serratia symbiotica TaxID=138074 RepID=UPI001CEFD9A8|nr:HD family hydrolase [Serratia symbiotica]
MSYIQTLSGKKFNYLNATVDDIEIEDIATALSHLCRFCGHLPEFYSVAQHSVLCSQLVPPMFAFEALMHDAAEAYCQDIPAPLKALLPDYRQIEAFVDELIRFKFNLPITPSPDVKYADLKMLATERRDLDISDDDPWPMLEDITPSDEILVSPVNPNQARSMFMQRFLQLSASSKRTRIATTGSSLLKDNKNV